MRIRIAEGWRPAQSFTPAVRKKASHKGGLVSAEQRRRRRALLVAEKLSRLLAPTVLRGMEDRQVAAFKVALVRAYLLGHKNGFNSGSNERRKREAA